MIQGGLVIGTAPPGTVALTLDGAPVPVAPDGAFVIAFDRDAGPAATLAATRGDGATVARHADDRAARMERSRGSSTLPKYPVPPADFDRLRPAETRADQRRARASTTTRTGGASRSCGRRPGAISTLFGSQRIYQNGEAGSYHSGIDIAVPPGTPVLAPADGVVILASDHPFLLEGNLLMVDHGMGLESAFMHLSRILVTPGAARRARAGDRLFGHDRPRHRRASPLEPALARGEDRPVAGGGADAGQRELTAVADCCL